MNARVAYLQMATDGLIALPSPDPEDPAETAPPTGTPNADLPWTDH